MTDESAAPEKLGPDAAPDKDTASYRLPLDEARDHLMVQVAKMFFSLERTQTEIATELGLTRWQVSRLIAEARETGVVRIQIVPRGQRMPDLEVELQRAYGLRDAVVVPGIAGGTDENISMESVAQAAGQYLASIKPRTPLIGVSWGRTMAAVAQWLPPNWADGVHVVQINGAVALRITMARTTSVAEDFARAGRGTVTILPAPAIVGSARTREVLEEDRVLADVQRLIDRAGVLCFSFGALSRGSVLVSSGYLDARDIDDLGEKGAVGDILGRFIDRRGKVVDAGLDARTIGLKLDSLKGRDRVVGVCSGKAKHQVALAALRAGYVNVLVTDQATARYAIEHVHDR